MSLQACRSSIVSRIAGILAALASGIAPAQPYPVKPIEIVVHTSAGSGGTDSGTYSPPSRASPVSSASSNPSSGASPLVLM